MLTLFSSGTHKNIWFNDLSSGHMVQANQHLIVHDGETMILDPGGHKVHTKLYSNISTIVPVKGIKHLFFSHQDPDIIAAANGWLMMTEAEGYLSSLWMRFIPHFGVDEFVQNRIHPIPDEGMTVAVGGSPVHFLPAPFLHSAGNFHVYDPVAKILYTGDLGASLGNAYAEVTDFDAHIPYMKGFHQRYLPGNRFLRRWVAMARKLDVEIIAPQHGAVFPNRELSNRFIDWLEGLPCGGDLMGDDDFKMRD